MGEVSDEMLHRYGEFPDSQPDNFMNEPETAVQLRPQEQNLPLQSTEQPAVTSAQARVEAVATVLHKAYERASELRLSQEESAALVADFPDDAFQPGAAGKENLLYIEHAYLRDRFNSVLGIGQWTIIRTKPHWAEDFTTQKGKRGTRLYAECALVIRGCFVSENIGSMDYYPNDATNYGDAAKGAVTAAFRRCASDIGVGLQPFKKGWCEEWKTRRYRKMEQAESERYPVKNAEPKQFNGDKPLAKRINDMANWVVAQIGPVDGEWLVPYLRAHTPDGSDKTASLMPNEMLDALSEASLAAIKADPKGFLERVKKFAQENDQIPGAEVTGSLHANRSPITTQVGGLMTEKKVEEVELWKDGTIDEISSKSGETNGKPWTLCGVKIGRQWYNTFSKTLADAANKLVKTPVRFTCESTNHGYNLIAIDDGKEIIRAGKD